MLKFSGKIVGFNELLISRSHPDFDAMAKEGASPLTIRGFPDLMYPTDKLDCFIVSPYHKGDLYIGVQSVREGLTDDQRIDFWKRRRELVGKTIEFDFDEKTGACSFNKIEG